MTHLLDAVKTATNGTEPSLKAIAMVMEIPTTRLYAMAKKPVPGQVYDPSVINWEVVNEYLTTKLEEETAPFATMEDMVVAAVKKDEWLAENHSVRVSTGNNMIEVDGGTMPKRKSAMFEMGGEQESYITFKRDPNVYKIVYQTAGYTVLRPVAADGEFCKEEVRVISNMTLNTKCVPPCNMKKSIEDRFSGAYAERLKEAENASQTDAE